MRNLLVEPVDEQRKILAEVMATLSCEMRMRMLEVLSETDGTLHVDMLAEHIGLAQSTCSHHLRRFVAIGFVHCEKHGVHHHYHVNHEYVMATMAAIATWLKR